MALNGNGPPQAGNTGPQGHANPFDVLPAQLFNILATSRFMHLQRHYLAILLRLYEMAEFNRGGLVREVVLAEIVDYLGNAEVAAEVEEDLELESDLAQTNRTLQEYASWIVRRLDEAGWIEREQHADYTEYIVLPDYAFSLLEAFRTIQQQKPREYTGQLYAAHQLITNESDDFSPALAVSQAYENVRQVLRGLNELNQNIRRYTERVTRNKDVAELMRLQFDDYAPALGSAYHALKTSDHVSRYRRDIISRLHAWQMDRAWLDRAANDLALQRRLSPAQAADEITHYVRFIIDQLESLDPLLAEIDERHTHYLRTSLRQIRYQLVSADGSFKDRLATLAQHMARLQDEGLTLLPDEAPTPKRPRVDLPDRNSYYTMPTRRAPFQPATIVRPMLDPTDASALRLATLLEISATITPGKVQTFVHQFLNGHRSMHSSELPPAFFADMEWTIFTLAYGHHPEVDYGVERADGEPVDLGPYLVKPFRLTRK